MSESEDKEKARARREKRRRDDPQTDVELAPASAPAKKASRPRTGRARASTNGRASPKLGALSDREAVLAANAVFYRALESKDADAMAETWARVPHARCIHPGWEPLYGWEEIIGSWSQIFRSQDPLRFELADVVVRVSGGLGWVELAEHVEAVHEGKPARTQVLATNLFERQPDGRWLMIHHHASPIMVRQPAPRRGGEPLH